MAALEGLGELESSQVLEKSSVEREVGHIVADSLDHLVDRAGEGVVILDLDLGPALVQTGYAERVRRIEQLDSLGHVLVDLQVDLDTLILIVEHIDQSDGVQDVFHQVLFVQSEPLEDDVQLVTLVFAELHLQVVLLEEPLDQFRGFQQGYQTDLVVVMAVQVDHGPVLDVQVVALVLLGQLHGVL